jgi:hydrogenase/urease accessory protein HupE
MIRRVSMLLWCLGAAFAAAHEVRPAYLELTETAPGQFSVLWKVPALGEMVLALQPVLPAACAQVTATNERSVNGALVGRWVVDCGPTGINGEIRIDGLQATLTDVLVRIAFLGGATDSRILHPNAAQFTVDVNGGTPPLAGYLRLGIEHILTGIDHLLFVLGLLLIVRGTARIVKTITAFTVAHSITLALAALGYVHVPQAPVEAVIALSILFLASEIMRKASGAPGLTETYPWLIAFIFGLLHGFGFAGALAEVGLPPNDIPLALLLFNVGVEIGQLAFVAAVLGIVRIGRRITTPPWLPVAATYGIGAMAAFWVIQRVAAIVGIP